MAWVCSVSLDREAPPNIVNLVAAAAELCPLNPYQIGSNPPLRGQRIEGEDSRVDRGLQWLMVGPVIPRDGRKGQSGREAKGDSR